jgi:hypothetical protein
MMKKHLYEVIAIAIEILIILLLYFCDIPINYASGRIKIFLVGQLAILAVIIGLIIDERRGE